jgi:hypothetical protein
LELGRLTHHVVLDVGGGVVLGTEDVGLLSDGERAAEDTSKRDEDGLLAGIRFSLGCLDRLFLGFFNCVCV